MLAEIIAIGREILTGKTLDTNSHWLAQQLYPRGFRVKRIVAVDDVVEEIAHEILSSIKYGVSLIVTTGGLGPTFDDKTLEAVAVATGRKLLLNENALKMVQERYREFYQKGWVDSPDITPERKKMAILPDGSIPLPNPVGAAPGVWLPLGSRVILSLPGVPKEMKAIFTEYAVKRIEEFREALPEARVSVERTINSGIGDESLIAQVVKEVMAQVPNVYIKSLPETFGKAVDIPVRFTAEGKSEQEAQKVLEQAIELFTKLLKERLDK